LRVPEEGDSKYVMISDGGALAGSWRRKRRHDECRSPSTETATERAPSERASEAPALAGQAVLSHLPSPPKRAVALDTNLD